MLRSDLQHVPSLSSSGSQTQVRRIDNMAATNATITLCYANITEQNSGLTMIHKRDLTYLKTVLDERLGVEKTMKEHLSRCHCHLRSKNTEYDVCTFSCVS